MISSDSDLDTLEPKKQDDSLWKFQPPKKCSEYIPEETNISVH